MDKKKIILGISGGISAYKSVYVASGLKKKGYEPMLYGNPTWLGGSVDRTLLTDYDVWLAHYTDYTNYPYEFSMWQYTSTGTVAGIEGDVDMNVRIIEK